MRELFFDALVLIACFVLFSGALGIVRLKDAYQRFHAAGKVSLVGLALLLIADFFRSYYLENHMPWMFLAGPVVVVVVGPVATHILARTLYHSKKD